MTILSAVSAQPTAAAAPTTIPKPKDDPKKISEAASQFEALLIHQMLQSAHASDGTGMSEDDDSSEASALVDLGEQQFSQALANSGGLGIAKMVVAGLKTHANR
jgi:Rod binding domain-containing protein